MLSDDELYNELQGPDAQELLAELNGANERACAVVGAARLDDLLRELLEAYIVEDRDARNQLYGVANPQAMFREFGTKTAVAYAVGLIDDDLCRELRKIGDIRNSFSHRWRSSFDDAPIKKLCSSLSIPKDASVPFPGSQAPKPKPKWNLHRHRTGQGCQHRHSGERRNPGNCAEYTFLVTGLQRCDEGFFCFKLGILNQSQGGNYILQRWQR